MSQQFADRLARIQPSPSVEANARVTELRAQGRDIVNFTIGEPDFDTPAHIAEAAIAALKAGDTHYTPSAGTQALRQAVADKLARDNNLGYARDEVVIGAGGKHILYHALAATLNPGDEVIVPAPYWVSYPDLVALNEGVPRIVICDAACGFKLSAKALASAITHKTRWLVLNTPSNPTGAVYTAAELDALAAVLRENPHVGVISDEIYEHFVYAPASHLSLVNVAPDLKARTLIVNGASKGYAMTGWRIGFGAGPRDLVRAIVKLISQTTTCPSSLSQAAAVAAFAGDQAPVREMAARYTERRRLMLEGIQSVIGVSSFAPDGAFYVYLDVGGLIGRETPTGQRLQSDDDVVLYWLESVGVAGVSGKAYGLSPYVRVSFAIGEEAIQEGCRRLGEACRALR
ncbi:aminotransferase class I/II-fold pyridoxal phosphate-dependent enzyme [Salinicola sp. JS01]|uniref:aminotransferase class I/II-fold pyridoxal phosphate-dependent enzyme n=1 Tax=Salinicola sp. JS01 TaxID=3050071 RepID=UPI00255BCACE|nr:aminotransferase class I/II-fold pyridoxal phosphate-dependent enzyme [Salinicola sp. JS01]WIX31733.1 aminotransferase class I/II-fold pyridoxal phosphate-dependent enzyme [Salinicola sp. JS01]